MGAVRCSAVLAVTITVVLLFCSSAAADFSIPFLPPFFGNACEKNVCGKGNCVKSDNSSFGFECECESGWKQARAEHDDFFKFLPCVIPNCTFNYTCTSDAAAPAPASHKRANQSIFDPCFWTDCGGGSCNTTSPFTHTCLCDEGYHNLFNSSTFPCYKDCSLGMDCVQLGINLMNTTNTSNRSHTVADESSGSGGVRLSNPGVEFGWWISMMASWGLLVWTYM